MIDRQNDLDDPLAWWGSARTDRVSLDCTLTAALSPDATIGTVAVLGFTRLPDLLCHLSHQDLVTRFVPGLLSACSPETRPFLAFAPRFGWEAHLGAGSRLSISAEEAHDLCTVVDEVVPLYQARLADLTTRLGLWGYAPTTTDAGKQAVRLCTVTAWLWQATMQFCGAHRLGDGESPWYRFLVAGDEMQIWNDEAHAAHVSLCGRPIFPLFGRDVEVEVLYCLPDLTDLAYRPQAAWATAIGEAGAWTAPYAADWFVETLLPQVLTYNAYSVSDRAVPVGGWKGLLSLLLPARPAPQPVSALLRSPTDGHRALARDLVVNGAAAPDPSWVMPLTQPAHLIPLLRDLQGWLSLRWPAPLIPSGLVRPCYATLAVLLARTHLPTTPAAALADSVPSQATSAALAATLTEKTEQLRTAPGEAPEALRNRCEEVVDLLEQGTIVVTQEQLTEAENALRPLWDTVRFQYRFTHQHR